MILRPAGDGRLYLITQPDHAALAGAIISGWNPAAFTPAAARPAVLLAVARHDNGWEEIDACPTLNPETGRPYDFMSAPFEFKQEIWPRGVRRLAASSPQAGALVAQHGLTIHGHRRGEETWRPFFEEIDRLRSSLLALCEAEEGDARQAFERNYDLVYLGDLMSLVFCNRWAEPQAARGYRIALQGDDLIVSPDPFEGRSVKFEVQAREILDREYHSDAELRRAWTEAPRVLLAGRARGPGRD